MAKRERAVDHDPTDRDGEDASSRSAHSSEGSEDKLINGINTMPTSQFRDRYVDVSLLRYSFKSGNTEQRVALDFKASSDLSKEELQSCFTLIETTSRADYEPSSFGWHPKRKRKEMLENEMKYVLVRKPCNSEDGTFSGMDGADSVAGFLSFMMTHDSTPSVPVLYIYEIHLEDHLRRTGLGSHLMHLAESVAMRPGVEKVMLTCFLSNEKALGFYQKRGYEKDASSPDDRKTRRKVVKVDYVIMSRRVTDMVDQHASRHAQQSGNVMLGAIRDLTSRLAGKQVQNGEAVAQMRGWV